MTAPDRPCPSWCVEADCTGWEGPGGVDGRIHRRTFRVRGAAVAEVYSMESVDGSTFEQGAEVWELEFVSVEDLRAYAVALAEAADLMKLHGIEAMTCDPSR